MFFEMPRGFNVASVKKLLEVTHRTDINIVDAGNTDYYEVYQIKPEGVKLFSYLYDNHQSRSNAAQFYGAENEADFYVWYVRLFNEAKMIQDKIDSAWSEAEVRSVQG